MQMNASRKPPILNKLKKFEIKDSKLLKDKYRVVREIGKGASAVVYLVERIDTGNTYAAKVFDMGDLAFSIKFENLEVRGFGSL